MKKEDINFDSLLLQTFDSMEYEYFGKDEVIFHYGDKGDKFYIILSGSVDVYLPKTADEISHDIKKSIEEIKTKKSFQASESLEDESEVGKSRSRKIGQSPTVKKQDHVTLEVFDELGRLQNGRYFTQRLSSNIISAIEQSYTKIFSKFQDKRRFYFDSNVPKFKKVRNMSSGSYFGEIALSSNMRRGATILASSDLQVATLTKEAYKNVCQAVESNLKTKWKFFSELLNNTARETLMKFCYSFSERCLRYNQKIFEEGQIPEEVYVIRSGDVQVMDFYRADVLRFIVDEEPVRRR